MDLSCSFSVGNEAGSVDRLGAILEGNGDQESQESHVASAPLSCGNETVSALRVAVNSGGATM
jgi:hypothetical protein